MVKIINRFTESLICEEALLSLKETVQKNKANLREADLWGANLRGANLWGADLRGADLWGADLRGADLRGADLREADLREANLQEANLWEADLRGADLREANLQEANLWEADLRGADLREAKLQNNIVKNYKEICGVGYNKRQLRCFLFEDNSFYFMAGCFSGNEEDLKKKVLEKYGEVCEYMEAIEFLKQLCIKY
jgi:hypothetical protein